MPTIITSLNNDAAVSRTINLIGSDMTSQRWINISDTNPRQTFKTQTRLTGRRGSLGIPARQFNLSILSSRPFTTQVAGTERQANEEMGGSFTFFAPELLTQHTATHAYDIAAYFRQLITAANMDKWLRGEP